jgi:hypothetical protein
MMGEIKKEWPIRPLLLGESADALIPGVSRVHPRRMNLRN